MRALLLLSVLSACWSSSQPAPAAPQPSPEPVASRSSHRSRPAKTSCQRTLDRMADTLRPELAKTGFPEATIDELIDAAVESCLTMDWSADLLACYDGVADASELDSCQKLMSAEQSEDVSRRMMEVVSRMSQQQYPAQAP